VSEATIKNHAAFIWSVADLLRGEEKQCEYGKAILPLVVLRRIDCVLQERKQGRITAALTGQFDLARELAEEVS
jgi:type I restriction enzyme M protein